MKFAAILGCRNPHGQTAKMADAFLEGLASASSTWSKSILPELRIERCRQCDADGWGICRSQGQCVIQDDFAGVVEKIRASDAAAFVTPVYFGDLSESLRAFLDRLRRICRHEAGKKGLTGKPAIGICVAGGGGGGSPACGLSLERILGECGFRAADMIPVQRQNTELKLEVLKITGRHFARLSTPAT
jgi:multimeric flavodoxin WrbA